MNKKTTYFLLLLTVCFSFLQAQDNERIQKLYELSLEELLEVTIVTANRTVQEIKDIPASVIVITKDDIENFGYLSLEEILQNIPGLYMIDSYYWVGTVNYGARGFFATGSLGDFKILVNGVSQEESWYDSSPLSKIAVPVEAIDRIEVVRGPMSIIYGSGSFFGAINIITNENIDSRVKVSFGSNNTYNIFARKAFKTNKINLILNAGIRGTDGIDIPYSKLTNDIKNYEGIIPQGKSTNTDLQEHNRFFNVSLKFNDFESSLIVAKTNKGIIDGIPAFENGHQIDLISITASLKYLKHFSERFFINSQIDYSYYSNNYFYGFFEKNTYGNGLIISEHANLSLNFHYQPFDELKLLFGFANKTVLSSINDFDIPIFGDEVSNAIIRLPQNDNIVNIAGYTQIEYNPSDWMKFIVGLRYEHTGDFDILNYRNAFTPVEVKKIRTISKDAQLIPSFASIIKINQSNYVKLLYGEAIKNPPIGNSSDLVYYPNLPLLEPAQIKTYEINYLSSLSDIVNVNFSFFYNDLEKIISRLNTIDPEGGDMIVSMNSGALTTSGFESNFHFLVSNKLILNLSLSYQKSENKDKKNGDPPALSPEFLGYIKSSYKLNENINLSLVGRYIGEMEADWDKNTQTRVGDKSDSYFVFDANIKVKNLFYKDLYFDLNCKNVLDKEIYYPTTISSLFADKGTIGLGRIINIGIGMKF